MRCGELFFFFRAEWPGNRTGQGLFVYKLLRIVRNERTTRSIGFFFSTRVVGKERDVVDDELRWGCFRLISCACDG